MTYKREISVALAYLALLALLAWAAPAFYRGDQLRTILVASAPILVATVGMTLVILTRNIDISIGSQVSICGIAAGLLAKEGLPMPLVVVLVMALGAAFGSINGLFVAVLQLPSIVVTLATMVILVQALRWAREGEFVSGLPATFQWFGLGQTLGQAVIVGTALAILLAFAVGLRYVAAGRAVYAVGSDAEAARLVGIRPRRAIFAVFALMGALAGLAALLDAVRLAVVDPSAGTGFELQVIAAVVVGGVAISGGRGNLIGPLIGVLLLGTIRSALVFLGAEAHWDKAIQGAIILVAVASDALTWKQRRNARTSLATH